MDRGELMQKAGDLLRKYRWPILVLVIGVILMLLPSAEPHDSVTPAASQSEKPGMDQELAHILQVKENVAKLLVFLMAHLLKKQALWQAISYTRLTEKL